MLSGSGSGSDGSGGGGGGGGGGDVISDGGGAGVADDGILRAVPASPDPEAAGGMSGAPAPLGSVPTRSPLSRRLVRARPFFDARVLGRWEPAPAPLSPGSGGGGAGGAFAPELALPSASAHAADEAAAALPAGSAASLQVGTRTLLFFSSFALPTLAHIHPHRSSTPSPPTGAFSRVRALLSCGGGDLSLSGSGGGSGKREYLGCADRREGKSGRGQGAATASP